jgi:hypothetical protein
MGRIHCIIFVFSEEHWTKWKLHGYEMIRYLAKNSMDEGQSAILRTPCNRNQLSNAARNRQNADPK